MSSNNCLSNHDLLEYQLSEDAKTILLHCIVTITPPDPEHPQGTIYYRDRQVDHEELRRRLSEVHDRSKQASVVIRADRRVPFSEVASVMAIAETAQLPSFIAVLSPGDRRSASFEKQDR